MKNLGSRKISVVDRFKNLLQEKYGMQEMEENPENEMITPAILRENFASMFQLQAKHTKEQPVLIDCDLKCKDTTWENGDCAHQLLISETVKGMLIIIFSSHFKQEQAERGHV